MGATLRQQKLAQNIILDATGQTPPRTAQQILEDSGYSYISARSSAAMLMKKQGVLEELAKYGFTADNAKMVIAEIMLDQDVDANARLKASDMALKVYGEYAPEKKELSGTVQTGPTLSAELIAEAEELLKQRKLNADITKP